MLFTLLLACSDPAPTIQTLTIAGSSTIQPVAERAAQAFEASHPNARINVQGGGSSVGISSTRSGLADIGMVSRSLKPEESDLTPTVIGKDGLAMIVHKSNPLAALTSAQVVEIYTGATSSWLAFQGSDRPITVINKEEGRATLELFENFFKLKGKFVGTAIIIGPNGQAIQTVAGNPDSIAYVSIGSATVAEAQGTTIKRVSLDGVEATVETVSAGKYPLSRELTLTTKGPASGLAREFMDFMLSSDGQAIVQAEDFVPVGPAIKTTSGN